MTPLRWSLVFVVVAFRLVAPSQPLAEDPIRNPDWAYDQTWVRAPWDKDGAEIRRITSEVSKIAAPSAQLDHAVEAAAKAGRGSQDLLLVFRWASLAERKANWQQLMQGAVTIASPARALAAVKEGRGYVEVAKLRFATESRWFIHPKTNAGINFLGKRLYAKLPDDRLIQYRYAIRMAQSTERMDRLSALGAARKLPRAKPEEATYWYVLDSALRLHAGQENDLAIARQAIDAYREALRRPGINRQTRHGAAIGIKQVHLRFPELDKGAARR